MGKKVLGISQVGNFTVGTFRSGYVAGFNRVYFADVAQIKEPDMTLLLLKVKEILRESKVRAMR